MVGLTMNLISKTHHLCERKEYAFMVLQEYTIISPTTTCILSISGAKNSNTTTIVDALSSLN